MKRFFLHLIISIALVGCYNPMRSCSRTIIIENLNNIQSTHIEGDQYLLVWDYEGSIYYKVMTVPSGENPPESVDDVLFKSSKELADGGTFPRVRKMNGEFLITYLKNNRETGDKDLHGGVYSLDTPWLSSPGLRLVRNGVVPRLVEDVGESYDFENLENGRSGLLLKTKGKNIGFYMINIDNLRTLSGDFIEMKYFNENDWSEADNLKYVTSENNILISWQKNSSVYYCFLDRSSFSEVHIPANDGENTLLSESGESYGTVYLSQEKQFLIIHKSDTERLIKRVLYQENEADGSLVKITVPGFLGPDFVPGEENYVENKPTRTIVTHVNRGPNPSSLSYNTKIFCPDCEQTEGEFKTECIACKYNVHRKYSNYITRINGISQYPESGHYTISLYTDIIPTDSYRRSYICDNFRAKGVTSYGFQVSFGDCMNETYISERRDRRKKDAFWFNYSHNIDNPVITDAEGHPGGGRPFRLLSDDLNGYPIAMFGPYLQQLK